jgi:uncharacterized membrane protein YphA (DoxX/SURF4 family)
MYPWLNTRMENLMATAATISLQPRKATISTSIVRYLPTAGRLLLGLLFFVFGLNGFLNFIPQPSTPLPAAATSFSGALMATGYMLPLIATTQLIVGTLLLANRFVPLALVLLAPFMVNSILFHVFLEPSGRPMAFIVLALQLYLVWINRKAFRSILTART